MVFLLQTAKYLQPEKAWKVWRGVETQSVHYDLKNTHNGSFLWHFETTFTVPKCLVMIHRSLGFVQMFAKKFYTCVKRSFQLFLFWDFSFVVLFIEKK